MIKEITLEAGRIPGGPATQFAPSGLTVFVGPNNSGKSLALREIASRCTHPNQNKGLVVSDLSFSGIEQSIAEQRIRAITLKRERDDKEGYIRTDHHDRRLVAEADLIKFVTEPSINIGSYLVNFMRPYTLTIHGDNRTSLINDQTWGDLLTDARTSLPVLLKDDDKRKKVQNIIFDALGLYFVIDPTKGGQARIKLSKVKPPERIEQRLDPEAIEFFQSCQPIQNVSDGIKAFVGIMLTVIAGDPLVLIIDEPEAFLHPPLARVLGRELALAIADSSKKVFVSTHSSSFLMGCLSAGGKTDIVRVTYRDDIATARILPNDEVVKLMRKPMLRSTGVMEALFYENVIITEGDSDRAFYQEMNDRLLMFDKPRAIPDCLFLNARSKQTIDALMGPLRALGIPAAAIYDLDVLNVGGKEYRRIMEAGGLPSIEQDNLCNQRSVFEKALRSIDLNYKRKGGKTLLSKTDREALEAYLERLEHNGIFVVSNGELESWLSYLGITGEKEQWLPKIFDRIGEDPKETAYLKPGAGDVWDFLNRIRAWMVNPNRKGIPG